MTDEITDSIGGYLMGMVVLAFFNSLVAFFLHLFLGLPFPALMAVAAFAITLIPSWVRCCTGSSPASSPSSPTPSRR